MYNLGDSVVLLFFAAAQKLVQPQIFFTSLEMSFCKYFCAQSEVRRKCTKGSVHKWGQGNGHCVDHTLSLFPY